ncbi:MAG: hypothetical protein WBQ89_03075 [Candidatus Acidiferrum sp.]
MPGSLHCRYRRSFWELCVSVLLIGLILYNPFLALANHSDGLTYQASARHRATVGASEMQHYTPVQGETAQIGVAAVEIFIQLGVEIIESSSHILEEAILPQRPELIASVWFRPPPTR